MNLRHYIPSEVKDEGKWFKFFYKRNLLYLMVGLAVTVVLYNLCKLLGVPLLGAFIGALITIALTAVSMIPVGEDKYMTGAGLKLDEVIIRKQIRKAKKVIYMKIMAGGSRL